MRYNDFKGDKVSVLGFGTMRLPMDENGNIDYTEGERMTAAAMEGGVTYFDTAYRYHGGEAENFCGRVISKYPRESYMLADKLPTWLCKTIDDAERIFEEQLKKCNVDYFDFYLLHNVDEETWPNIERLDLISFVSRKKSDGLARHIGLSVHCKPALLEEVLKKHGDTLEFVQIQLNYFDWEYQNAKELYSIARRYDKPVIVMEPLRGGMLAKLPSAEARRLVDDAARKSGDRTEAYPSYALRYAQQLEGVMCTLSGMSDLQQMQDNIRTSSGPLLSHEQLEAISQAGLLLQSDMIIPCTGCNYCFECPAEIKIPKLFSWYNEAAARGFHYIWGSLSKQYEELGPNAGSCIGCGNCESHCPQKIEIISLLKKLDRKYTELKNSGE